ncbi:MAG TPA: hypothetical protein VN802_01725 [Stellaceae bacterium]|nr:hypothetical protein [Stellaceae bacterium]
MTASSKPGSGIYDFDAALRTAAEGVADAICDAVSADLPDAHLEPVLNAVIAANDAGLEVLRSLRRQTGSGLDAALPA